jgi:hypothetical protein
MRGLVRSTIILALLIPPILLAQSGPSENEVKAAFVYNFAKFIAWPTSVFQTTEQPLYIGVLGEKAAADRLMAVVQGKTANNRRIVVIGSTSINDLMKSQIIVFASTSETELKTHLDTLISQHILTVGEGDEFLERGGIIRLYVQDARVRFAVNVSVAEKTELSVSSSLLRLASDPGKPRSGD